jgi:hypothetical protein
VFSTIEFGPFWPSLDCGESPTSLTYTFKQ